MNLIQKITDAPYQKHNLVLSDGTVCEIILVFMPMQLSWFIRKLSYKDRVIHNIRITNLPNILYQWKNLLPFGIGCFTAGGREPSLAEDFLSGVSKLYTLDAAEVEEFTEYIQDD